FSTATPGTITARVPIAGLIDGDPIVGIDFRPATGQLYALGRGSRLYTIDPGTGVATQVGSDGAFNLGAGQSFSFDFNPVVDRIRVTSDSELNLRLNPNDGTLVDGDPDTPGIQPDANLAFAAGDPNTGQNPDAGGAAYTNNFAGATTTTLFDIDTFTNSLV